MNGKEHLSNELSLRPSPRAPDRKLLHALKSGGHQNNVVALRAQLGIHEVLNDPLLTISNGVRSSLRRIQGVCFEGYGPHPEDLDYLERAAGKIGDSEDKTIERLVSGIRCCVEEQKAHWERTGYTDELLREHQDTDAVAEFARMLGGRIVAFGSARKGPDSPEFDAVRWIMATLVEGLPYADGTTEQVLTGAGPGVMEAANLGAMQGARNHYQSLLRSAAEHPDDARIRERIWNFRMQLQSIGIRIALPFEAGWNPYVQCNLTIKGFGLRKKALVSGACGRSTKDGKHQNSDRHGRRPALFSFTGGFGTLDEEWEVLTLEQCGKMRDRLPVLMVGKEKNRCIRTLLEAMVRAETIDPIDCGLVILCADEIDAVEKYLAHYNLSATPQIAAAISARRGNTAL